MPGVTFVPFGAPNPDGTFNLYGGGLFSADGNLYATFDTGTIDFGTGTITPVIPDDLYRIDPLTGHATLIASTSFALDSFVELNGTVYAFKNNTGQVVTLDLSNGATTPVVDFDPAAGLIFGAAATPEPASIALAAIGLAWLAFHRSRRRR